MAFSSANTKFLWKLVHQKAERSKKFKNPSVKVIKIEENQGDDGDLQTVLRYLITNDHN